MHKENHSRIRVPSFSACHAWEQHASGQCNAVGSTVRMNTRVCCKLQCWLDHDLPRTLDSLRPAAFGSADTVGQYGRRKVAMLVCPSVWPRDERLKAKAPCT